MIRDHSCGVAAFGLLRSAGGEDETSLAVAFCHLEPRRRVPGVETRRAQPLVGEVEPVVRAAFESEGVVVGARGHLEAELRLHTRRVFRTAKELVIGAAVQRHEPGEFPLAHHRPHHFEEAKEVRFPGAVRADQDGHARPGAESHIRERAESLDADARKARDLRVHGFGVRSKVGGRRHRGTASSIASRRRFSSHPRG